VYRLVNTIKTRRGVNDAYGVVEGILAAAVLYTLLAVLMQLLLKRGGPRCSASFGSCWISSLCNYSILHAITAEFREVRDRYREHNYKHGQVEKNRIVY
ncbi:hypothetical protein S40293_01494, partial [Stachybotrys chartarum IBT 40293]